jgi:hypothetical protein
LPLIVSVEPTQPPDVVLAAATETEVDRLRWYLEVSQAALEVAK